MKSIKLLLCVSLGVIVLTCAFSLSCTLKKSVDRPFVRYLLASASSSKITGIPVSDDFDLHTNMQTIKNPEAGRERKSPISGNILPYKRTYKYTSHELTDSMKYGAMDIYETDKESVGFLYHSDQVAFYYDTDSYSVDRTRDYEMDELVSIAASFLYTAFGEGWDEGMSPSIREREGYGGYELAYTRHAYGYTLYDTVSVTINGEGRVVGFNGVKFGILKDFTKKYSEVEIEQAKGAIIQKIDSFGIEDARFSTPAIEANPSGEAYLIIYVEARETDARGSTFDTVDSIATPLRLSDQ